MSPEKNHWENPEIFGENRRDPHVPLKSFPSTKSALEYWDKGGGPDNLHLLSNICINKFYSRHSYKKLNIIT
jgi:hypothetical protein